MKLFLEEDNFPGLNEDQSNLYRLVISIKDATINKLRVHSVKEFRWDEKKFHKILKELVAKRFVTIEEP